MSDLKLTSPKVRVQFFDHVDREPMVIQSANPDLVLWDMTRVRHKWPKFDEAPFLWLTFVAWAAARRTGAIEPDVKWDTWREECADAEALSDDDDDGDEGRPTDAGPAPA